MFPVSAENPWIEVARAARRRIPAWLVFVLGGAIAASAILLIPDFAQGLLARVSGGGNLGDLAEAGVVGLFVFGLLLAVAAVGARVEGRSILAAVAQKPLFAALGLACGVVGVSLALGFVWMSGSVTSAGPAGGATASVGAAAAAALLIALQSGAEEVYFRGWIQPLVCLRWGSWTGLLATAALFALLHVISAATSITAVANMFLGGLLFGLLSLRTGGLWAPFLAHWSWNWVEAWVFGVGPDSPRSPIGLALAGQPLWTGGSDGLSGGIGATFALACLVLALLAAAPAKPAAQPAARRSSFSP